MTNVRKDNNQVPTMSGISNVDGVTQTLIKVNPTNHQLMTDDDTTGSDLSGDLAVRDENGFTNMMGVSSADGVTPTPIYVDPTNGKILVDSS